MNFIKALEKKVIFIYSFFMVTTILGMDSRNQKIEQIVCSPNQTFQAIVTSESMCGETCVKHNFRLWMLGSVSPTLIRTDSCDAFTPVFSPNGKYVAYATGHLSIRIINLQDPENTSLDKNITISNGEIAGTLRNLAFSSDGLLLATCNSSIIFIYDLETGAQPKLFFRMSDSEKGVEKIVFAPNRKFKATVTCKNEQDKYKRTFWLWQIDSNESALVRIGQCDTWWGVVFSPNGRYVACARDSSSIQIIDLQDPGNTSLDKIIIIPSLNAAISRRITQDDNPLCDLTFSADNKLFAVLKSKNIYVYDLESDLKLRKIFSELTHDNVKMIGFCRDNQYLQVEVRDAFPTATRYPVPYTFDYEHTHHFWSIDSGTCQMGKSWRELYHPDF